MQFRSLLAAAVAVAVVGVSATPYNFHDPYDIFGADLSRNNHWGAPKAPWKHGKPGWYYGNNPQKHPGIPCLHGAPCKALKSYPWFLQCPKPHPPPKPTSSKPTSTTPTSTPSSTPTPPPSDGYHPTFTNITGAVQADDYMTFGLVDTIADCKTMCDNVAGCNFVNTYNDVNGKDGSTQLSCSLFTGCHTAADADNVGGQTQPDGSVDFIANSDGWCKD